MCKYCEKYLREDCKYETKYLSKRKESKHNPYVYTGIQTFIDTDKNVIDIYTCIDNKNIKPVYEEIQIPINYCPMCGRKLIK